MKSRYFGEEHISPSIKTENRFMVLQELQQVLGFRYIDIANLLKIVLKSDDCLLEFCLGDITIQFLRGSEAWAESDGNEENDEYEDVVQLVIWLQKKNVEKALSYRFRMDELAFAQAVEQTPSQTEGRNMEFSDRTRTFETKQNLQHVDGIPKTDLTKARALGRTVARTLHFLRKFSYPLSITAVSKALRVKHERANEAICFLDACGWLKVSKEKHGSLRYQHVQLSNTGKKIANNAARATWGKRT